VQPANYIHQALVVAQRADHAAIHRVKVHRKDTIVLPNADFGTATRTGRRDEAHSLARLPRKRLVHQRLRVQQQPWRERNLTQRGIHPGLDRFLEQVYATGQRQQHEEGQTDEPGVEVPAPDTAVQRRNSAVALTCIGVHRV
jgi:hypothetical protein